VTQTARTMTCPSEVASTRPRRRTALTPPKKQAANWGSLSKPLPARTRVEVVARFRAQGGDFGRWSRLDHQHLANAMTATEDWLELEHPGWKLDRAELLAARRRLECKLWP
jgi:hypothetical protein